MINQFKEQISRQGLARNSRWLCRVYPPKGLASSTNILSGDIGNDLKLSVNLPGIDLIDNAVQQFNDLNFDVGLGNLGGVNFSHNLNLPTLGYTLTNTLSATDALNLFCVSCDIPEREFKNLEWREYGESRQLGYLHSFKGISVSYYCSEDLRERLFFEKWMDTMFNPDNKRRSYYEEYIGNIEIVKFDAGWNNQTAMYRFKEAYPSNIASQNLTYDGTSIMRLDMTFKFRNYERLK